MRLNSIKDNAGANTRKVRIGRGIGSGMGKMGGRGGKGQTARSGVAIGGFEGGQMPLHRRLPKRGFNAWRPEKFNEINIGGLQKAIDEKRLDGTKPIDVASLVAAGVLRRAKDGLRLLGDGEIKAKVSITVNHASPKAKAAVEKAGGTVNVIAIKILAADVAKRNKSAAKKAAKAGGGNKKPAAAAKAES
jgi:large subunit ribosomal protein L15